MSGPQSARKKNGKMRARQQAPEPRKPHNCARRLTFAAKLVGLTIAILQWVTSANAEWPAGSIAEWVLAAVATGIICFHLVNTRTRIELEHWKTERLQRVLRNELAVGCGIPATVLAVIVIWPPTWLVLFLIGVLFVAAEMLYEPIEEEIRQIVEDEPGLDQGTSRFGNRCPFRFLGIDRTISEMAGGTHRPGLQRFLGFWVKPPWGPALSRTRTVILYAMLISCFVAFTAAADVRLQELAVPKQATEEATGDGAQADNPSPTTTVEANGPTPMQGHEPAGEVEQSCPWPPSYGAPPWARDNLNALYYGTKPLNATPPPGNEIGGCTGKAIVPAAEHGSFAYTIGRNELGEIRSVAVVSRSRELAPAIFLAPAAQRVLALLEGGLAPLGGYPIMEVAGGDAVAITSERGTFALVRNSKTLPGSEELAAPYVLLPPTAATAWAGAMNERGAWLWPLTPRLSGELREYGLATDSASTEAAVVVTYTPRDGSAQRDQYDYDLPAPQLSQDELAAYARTAR
jgi:hypothetical protein